MEERRTAWLVRSYGHTNVPKVFFILVCEGQEYVVTRYGLFDVRV